MAILELPFDNGDGTHNFSSPRRASATARDRARRRAIRVPDPRRRHALRRYGRTPTRRSSPPSPGRRTTASSTCALGARPGRPRPGSSRAPRRSPPTGSPAPTRCPGRAWQRWVGQPQRPARPPARPTRSGSSPSSARPPTRSPFAAALLGDPSVDSVRRRLELDRPVRPLGHGSTPPSRTGRAASRSPRRARPGSTAPRTPVALAVDGPAVALGGARATSSATPYAITAPGDVLVVTTATGRPRRDPLRQRPGRLRWPRRRSRCACCRAGAPAPAWRPTRSTSASRRHRRVRRDRPVVGRRPDAGGPLARPAGARRSPSRLRPTPSTRASSARGRRGATSRPRRRAWSQTVTGGEGGDDRVRRRPHRARRHVGDDTGRHRRRPAPTGVTHDDDADVPRDRLRHVARRRRRRRGRRRRPVDVRRAACRSRRADGITARRRDLPATDVRGAHATPTVLGHGAATRARRCRCRSPTSLPGVGADGAGSS